MVEYVVLLINTFNRGEKYGFSEVKGQGQDHIILHRKLNLLILFPLLCNSHVKWLTNNSELNLNV